MTNEKELFSITAAENEKAEQERTKRTTARADKPQTYYLYADDDLINAYDNASDAIKGLRDEPLPEADQRKLTIKDDQLRELAEKLHETRLTVNPVQSTQSAWRVELTDEMQHDLDAEDYGASAQAAPAAPAEPEAPEWKQQLQSRAPQTKAPDAVRDEPKHETSTDVWAALDKANAQYKEAIDGLKQREPDNWRDILKNAVAETPVPAMQQTPSEWKMLLHEHGNREPQAEQEAERQAPQPTQQHAVISTPDLQ